MCDAIVCLKKPPKNIIFYDSKPELALGIFSVNPPTNLIPPPQLRGQVKLSLN